MSARGLCWCGLNRESHDGREMDADGRMHRFNEPTYESKAQRIGSVLWPDPLDIKPESLDLRKIK